MSTGVSSQVPTAKPSAAPPPFGLRLGLGLTGIFIAAMVAGLNNRVGALALADVRGAWALSVDQGSWLSTAYAAAELVAMPFATWFAITLSLRRLHLGLIATSAAMACVLPLLHAFPLLLCARAIQGLSSGAMIPLLMMAALRFLPTPIRLHGLALYSMTATFAPNLAVWLAGEWIDGWHNWRLVYWHVVPLLAIAAGLVYWGIPVMPPVWQRFRQINLVGLVSGALGLSVTAIVLEQGERLDWFASPVIVALSIAAATCMLIYLVSEWYHPIPFIKLQLLARRNLGLGFMLFVCILLCMTAASSLPGAYLAHVWGYKPQQSAPIGLIVGLPQLVLAPAVALLLYREWVDARHVMALGVALIGGGLLLGAQLTDQWIWSHFMLAECMQMIGQPMAVVSLLFLATSVVAPMEGPFVAGSVNALRALGSLAGSALIGQLMLVRTHFHGDMLLDHAMLRLPALGQAHIDATLFNTLSTEAFVLSTADLYRLFGVLALLLVPAALCMQHIPSPSLMAKRVPQARASTPVSQNS